MTDPNIELKFSKLQMAANKGYQLVNKKYEEINDELSKSERRIKIANTEQHPLKILKNAEFTSGQNEKIQILRKNFEEIRQNIETLNENSKVFSIVIYGRKMAGKSTLMEILKHGDGKTIGKGTQRTIKEVRSYYWHSLKISDISGVDFSCEEVSDALKNANIILFLMTNDAPQAEEAECFAQLKKLGKPILGIINVRKILNFKQRDSILQDLKKILPNTNEIQLFIEKFKSFAPKYNQDWSGVKFMPTHLLAAYYSRIDRVKDEEIYGASNFVEIENLILGKVITHGEFLHFKNFIDTAAIPMYDMLLTMFKYSANSFKESQIWKDQSKRIFVWNKNFGDNALNQFNRLSAQLTELLKQEISQFVDLNYQSPSVNENWHAKMLELKFIDRYQELLKNLLIQCKVEFPTLLNDLMKELKPYLDNQTQTELSIAGNKIFGEYSDMILPTLLEFMPDMAWAGQSKNNDTGSMFYQAFFEPHAAANVAKKNLKEHLLKTSFAVLDDINDKAREILNKQILEKIEEVSKTAENYSYVLIKIGEFQGEIAEMLLNEYEGLNSELLTEAAKFAGINKLAGIKVTFRIPGEIFGIVAEEFNVNTESISKFLNEKIMVFVPEKSWYNTMKKMLECEFELDEYSLGVKIDDKTYSVTPKAKVSEQRIKLAQQISPYPIITQ